MGEKKFFVDWGGDKKEIVFEDDIPFGRFMEILNSSADLDSAVESGNLNLRVDSFARELMIACIKSPDDFKDDISIAKVPVKVMLQIIPKILKEYPLIDFLQQITRNLLPKSNVKVPKANTK